mgnify:CR=1 FL=1
MGADTLSRHKVGHFQDFKMLGNCRLGNFKPVGKCGDTLAAAF